METKEKIYEAFIEKYLTTKGGYVKADETGYDNKIGINISDMFSFIKTAQPREWKKVVDSQGAQAETYFIDRLKKNIDENGFLHVLRNGIKLNGVTINLIFFKPESNINTDSMKLYEQNICKLVRQLQYSNCCNLWQKQKRV